MVRLRGAPGLRGLVSDDPARQLLHPGPLAVSAPSRLGRVKGSRRLVTRLAHL